jgi:hypothetical protein
VGGIVHASCQSVFGRWVLYPLPPLCGIVSLVQCGTGTVSDRTEVTTVTSVLVESVWLLAFVRVSMLNHARPLPVLPRGHVPSVWLSREKGLWLTLA